ADGWSCWRASPAGSAPTTAGATASCVQSGWRVLNASTPPPIVVPSEAGEPLFSGSTFWVSSGLGEGADEGDPSRPRNITAVATRAIGPADTNQPPVSAVRATPRPDADPSADIEIPPTRADEACRSARPSDHRPCRPPRTEEDNAHAFAGRTALRPMASTIDGSQGNSTSAQKKALPAPSGA